MTRPGGPVAPVAAGVRALAGLVWPQACAACGAAHVAASELCDRCAGQLLSLVAAAYCPRCGATLGPNIPLREDGCAECPTVLPRISRVVRLGPYTGPLREMVRDLKYHHDQRMVRRLAGMLARRIEVEWAAGPAADLVLPVPMHWRRQLWRGCDHARALARALGRELGLPVGDQLVRIRHTPPQTALSRTRRLENVRGAFGLRRGSDLAGARIALVDDVTTTGATAGEAARALLAGGATDVILAVVAKAEGRRGYPPRNRASSSS